MKRMLATKFIDWIKKAFQSILIQTNGNDINVEIPGTLTANALDENPDYCGAIFQPINGVGDFEVASNLHVSNLGTIARGYFTVKAGRTIAAGTAIYQTSGQALHDAILDDDAEAMPYTHLLCKVKGGSIFWLTMTADGSDNVLLSANIELTAGMDCYVIAAVQSSSLAG
jgi:hypothetical protein